MTDRKPHDTDAVVPKAAPIVSAWVPPPMSQAERALWLTAPPKCGAVFMKSLNTAAPDCLPTRGGGLVDLRTGHCRRRIPDDLWTFECPAAMLPFDASLAGADRFFGDLFLCDGDAPAIAHAQRLLGHLLTGQRRADDRFVVVFDGAAASGKSTTLAIFRAVLGPLCVHIGRHDAPDAIAESALRKARVVAVGEGAPLPSAAACGPHSKVLLYTTPDRVPESMERRAIRLEFPAQFVPDAVSTEVGPFQRPAVPLLVEQLTRQPLLDEVFTWLVRGAQQWYESGSGPKPI